MPTLPLGVVGVELLRTMGFPVHCHDLLVPGDEKDSQYLTWWPVLSEQALE